MRKTFLCVVLACSLQLFANTGFVTLRNFTPDINIISTKSNTLQGSFSDNGFLPSGIAITPDGTTGIITNQLSADISIFDTQTLAVTVIPTPSNPLGAPIEVAITPDGTKALISDTGLGLVYIFDIASRTFTGTITVGTTPEGLAITPDGKRAFVTNFTSNTVSVIDLTTLIVTTISSALFAGPLDVAITPDGSKALVTNNSNNSVVVIDTTTFSLTPITGLGTDPQGIDITPDGKTAYVGHDVSIISIIDVASNSLIENITNISFSQPRFPTITPDGTRVYIPNNGSNTISIIDVATNTVIGIVTVDPSPWQLAFIPNPRQPALAACQKKNAFLFKTDRFNIITITPPVGGPHIVSFSIFRDPGLTQLVTKISTNGSSSLQFCEHGRKKGQCCTYFVVATDTFGDKTEPISITVGGN